MLDLERVRKDYKSPAGDIHAVNDVTLQVRGREFVVILGPSGSGKTTLLLLAAGLLRADSGHVRFEDQDLATLDRAQLLAHRRTRLGMVFQGFNLVDGLSAEENVAIPILLRREHRRRRDALARARAALAEVGLAHRGQHLPRAMSGGEKQRVAIARALVGKPKLVLADEPTGNLDTDTGDVVLGLLSSLSREQGVATILVTHDARSTRYADRIFEMRDGTLTEINQPMPATVGG
jgi:putative ABC transport system ATP-binding protein